MMLQHCLFVYFSISCVELEEKQIKIRIHKVGKQELTWKVYFNKVNFGVIYMFYFEGSKFFLYRWTSLLIFHNCNTVYKKAALWVSQI